MRHIIVVIINLYSCEVPCYLLCNKNNIGFKIYMALQVIIANNQVANVFGPILGQVYHMQ